MIPKIIWQTYKDSNPPQHCIDDIRTWLEKNHDYQWYYMDDNKCDAFMRDHFSDEYYQMYTSLPLGVMRADVWRVAVVYVYGGVYVDLDTRCLQSIDTWIKEDWDLVVGVENSIGSINNFVFAAAPRHPALLHVLNYFLKLYQLKIYLRDTQTPVQDFGQNGFSEGIIEYYNLTHGEGYNYNDEAKVKEEKSYFYSHHSHAFVSTPTKDTLVHHKIGSQKWLNSPVYQSWRGHQRDMFGIPTHKKRLNPIKFITTFSKSGYHVYGKRWIETFIEMTGEYENITAEIFVDGMDARDVHSNEKVKVYNYHDSITQHSQWEKLFLSETSKTYSWLIDSCIKFSFKSFVMMHALRNTDEGYVIWLDGDCEIINNNYDTWPENILENKFMACQREKGETHVETGVVVFDSEHKDKNKFLETFESLYMIPEKFNSFDQLFDGFVVGRTLDTTDVSYVDLNKEYGLDGIQSDPSSTFLHPEIKSRFIHNIGITGKVKYETWDNHKSDRFFRLIHGINFTKSPEEIQEEIKQKNYRLLSKINKRIR